ncbi:MAG: tryptophan synthase subunit beta [Phycisphaerales bacterium]|nr:tryptophan synthase subunit beta [Phycisphaerales bacterium]
MHDASDFERGVGRFGGQYVPEPLVAPLTEIRRAFLRFRNDAGFHEKLEHLLRHYAGRPTPLYFSPKLSARTGCRIYLKREDLLHLGAHKTNNTLGQGLLAHMMGKRRLIAETGAGQHGVATAMAGALFGIPTEIFMGAVDIERQAMNVFRMKLMGATVHPVTSGSATLKDAINEALRDWIARAEDTYYLFGTAAGPEPFPEMVTHFQSVIGREARTQILEAEGRLPHTVVACVGGGSNAIGAFHAFLDDADVQLIGAEAGGDGTKHGASLSAGLPGVFHGMHSYFLQDKDGQIAEAHSIAAGLDYPGVGPLHSELHQSGRARYFPVRDSEALEAFHLLAREDGILPALESAHAIALTLQMGKELPSNAIVLVNLSGRGDKDLHTVLEWKGDRVGVMPIQK